MKTEYPLYQGAIVCVVVEFRLANCEIKQNSLYYVEFLERVKVLGVFTRRHHTSAHMSVSADLLNPSLLEGD